MSESKNPLALLAALAGLAIPGAIRVVDRPFANEPRMYERKPKGFSGAKLARKAAEGTVGKARIR